MKVRPMLAKKFQPKRWTKEGMFVQPKLNGVRALYHEGVFMSRDGHTWQCGVEHLRAALWAAGSLMLDGELYVHGLSLQAINSRIAVVRTTPHDECEMIEYHVFDVVSPDPFYMRAAELEMLSRHLDPPIHVVPTHHASTLEFAEARFEFYKTHGYEGAIYRMPSKPYSFPELCPNQDNRVNYIMKRKDWLDLDCEIVRVEEGQGRLLNTCGALFLRTPQSVYVSAGSGMSDTERAWCWDHRDELPGHTVKIKFEMFSDRLVPLKPTIILLPTFHELSPKL